MSAFVASLPKVELHVHLEGSLRAATMWDLAERNGVDLGVRTPAELESRYHFDSFDDFLTLFLTGLDVLQTGEDFADATEALAIELAAQNVRYAEVTTTPFNHHRRGIASADYVEGLNEGRRRALAVHGVTLAWVCDIPRELEPPDLGFTADLITGAGGPEGVVGLGLGGPEPKHPPGMFAASFRKAKAAGLGSVPHAGETAGPESVWGAIDELGADRIGHGIRSIEDEELMEHLRRHDVPLEISLSSNVALGLVANIESHPLPRLLDAGVPVCLNTDDPAYFSTDLNRELALAQDVLGLSDVDLIKTQRTALDHSWAPQGTRSALEIELAAVV